jgi:hypothetical protein
MAPTLPPDFPESGRQAAENIRRVHVPSYIKVIEFVGWTWGDLGAIDKIIAMWEAEAKVADESISRLNSGLAKLTSADAVAHWEGNAREEYVNWRNDFKDNTLGKYREGVWSVKKELDAIHGNIWSIRGHVVAMVIEAAALFLSSQAGPHPAALAADVVAFLALAATWVDWQFRVKSDLDGKGRNLENIGNQTRIDRGGGAVSLPFRAHVIADWSNWEQKPK